MPFEIDFLRAGDSNGDAITMRYWSPRYQRWKIHVVDGGFVDTGDLLVAHIRKNYGNPTYIDHVVLTHADNDHAAGLIKIFENFRVGVLWMDRPWEYAGETIRSFHGNWTLAGLVDDIKSKHPFLVELEAAAKQNGTPILSPHQGSEIGDFVVLAPRRDRSVTMVPDLAKTPKSYQPAIPLVPAMAPGYLALGGGSAGLGALSNALVDSLRTYSYETWGIETLEETKTSATSPANEVSVVQAALFDGCLIVLTGDAGPLSMHEARNYFDWRGWSHLQPNLIQVPHHGSRRNITPSALNRWLGRPTASRVANGTAICSVGRLESDYPRSVVSNAFLRRGYPVVTTRDGHYRHYGGMEPRPGVGGPAFVPFTDRFFK